MSSAAAARAEARRKAILARGNDRLAKLTISARGEDPAYVHDDPPLPGVSSSRNFLGEQSTDMPTPNRRPSPSPSPRPTRDATPSPSDLAGLLGGLGSAGPDPSVWSPEQQERFLAALMGGQSNDNTNLLGDQSPSFDPSLPPMDNPLAAMLFPQAQGGKMPMHMAGDQDVVDQEPTRLQKFMPLIHLLAVWTLLAYFILFAEPKVAGSIGGSVWDRWARLGRGTSVNTFVVGLGVHVMPFFWAFTTLQIALHSLRIFSGFAKVQPPTLLAFALPHLPPPFPSIIVNSLKYLQMGSLFLDDLSGLIVGIGLVIYFAAWSSSNREDVTIQ
ncbi:hypothetical protein BDQ17DRAFT_179026 [Cyathus striatus]|nr:hypothetical protein BDQ17DRAFT_179026 [Cyathus striatus]